MIFEHTKISKNDGKVKTVYFLKKLITIAHMKYQKYFTPKIDLLKITLGLFTANILVTARGRYVTLNKERKYT